MKIPGLVLVFGLICHPAMAEDIRTHVAFVEDGDGLVLSTGEKVRLVDINAPEGPRKGAIQPFADAARLRLKELAEGQDIRIVTSDDQPRDKYDRILGHAYLNDGTWLNGQMVREGLAFVYSFPDNRMKVDALLPLERDARTTKRGIWSMPRWAVKNAAACCAPDDMGFFQIVEGQIRDGGLKDGTIYLNFGDDYRTDFTVRIKEKSLRAFAERGVDDPLAFYKGQTVRVRGPLEPVYGAMITATHPEQIEVLNADGSTRAYAPFKKIEKKTTKGKKSKKPKKERKKRSKKGEKKGE